jgi:hypothetical protein
VTVDFCLRWRRSKIKTVVGFCLRWGTRLKIAEARFFSIVVEDHVNVDLGDDLFYALKEGLR